MSILCATDFSPLAQAAADAAALLALKRKVPLRLLHCVQDAMVMGDLPVVIPDDKHAIDHLRQEAERLHKTGALVIEDFRHGDAAWEVLCAAREPEVELVVLGSTGHGAGNWLLGSVAEEVAMRSPVPALVLSQPQALITWLQAQHDLDVLLGVDLAGPPTNAVAWIKQFAALGPVKVSAAHVHPLEEEPASPEDHLSRERDVWDQVHAGLGELPLTVHVREAGGDPKRQFIQLIKEKNPGLVVVGCHQRHGWRRLAAASFSRRVLAYAVTNVLCIPVNGQKASTTIPSIHRVLVAADLSDNKMTGELLRHAQSLLADEGSICLVHVCHEPERGVNPLNASEVYFDHSLATERARREAAETIENLSAGLTRRPGVHFQSEILTHHDIATALCAAAERLGADVICMGGKRRSRVASVLLGSSVQAVLSRAHRPVFIIPAPVV